MESVSGSVVSSVPGERKEGWAEHLGRGAVQCGVFHCGRTELTELVNRSNDQSIDRCVDVIGGVGVINSVDVPGYDFRNVCTWPLRCFLIRRHVQ